MILNKEKGKRMWGGDGGSGGSGGSGFDPSTLAGYAQQSWVNDNFVSKSFFNQMFELQYSQRVLTKDGDTVISDVTTDMVATPNTFIDTTTQTHTDEETGYTIETTNTITGIKAKTGLWTPSYLSALGQNAGGGGGGSLNEPLLSINTSGLSAPGALQNGMTIVWDNATHKWKYGSAGGGGGTVTSIAVTVPTGFSVSPSSITTSGTFAITFDSGYSLPTTAKQSNWDTAYTNSHTHSNKSILDTISSSDLSHWDGAYNWVNTNGALTRTIWGQTYWNNGAPANVSGSIYAGSSGGSIEQFHSIELNSAGTLSSSGHYGGFIDFHYDGSAADYTSRIIEDAVGQLSINAKNDTSPYNYRKAGLCIGSGVDESYLQIGDIRLIYDQTNNAIKAEKSNGQAANFYATGGVSALGVPTSGSGTVDTLNVNTLKAVNNLYIGDTNNRIYYDFGDDVLLVESGSGDIALKGSLTMRGINATQRSISTQGGNLSLGGGYIYLTSGVYLFTDGSNVKVNINGTDYTLNKS